MCSLPAHTHTHSSRFMLLEISLKIKSRRCPVAFSAGLYIIKWKHSKKLLSGCSGSGDDHCFLCNIIDGHLCHQLKVLQCNCFISWKMAVRFQRALWEDCSRVRHESPPFIVFQAGAHGHWFECDSQDFRQTTDVYCFWFCRWKNFGFMSMCSHLKDFSEFWSVPWAP